VFSLTRAVLIYNPAAGRRGAAREPIAQFRHMLAERGIQLEARATSGPGEAADLARQAIERGVDCLIVRGGDGTVNEALQGLVGSAVPLAIWPAGTANVLASVLGIPRRLPDVVRMIAERQICEVSVGRANGRYFVLMVGIGLDASIVQEVNPDLKRRLGLLAYWFAGLKHLVTWKAPVFTLQLPGQQIRATFAAIANVPSYGGGIRMAPDARPETEEFRVCAITSRCKLLYALVYLPLTFLGWHIHLPGVLYMSARGGRAWADSGEPIPFQVDGELAGTLPVEFELIPRALRVIVPRTSRR
jgi:YegS/Rv2252/BmrU family lipid kinase